MHPAMTQIEHLSVRSDSLRKGIKCAPGWLHTFSSSWNLCQGSLMEASWHPGFQKNRK